MNGSICLMALSSHEKPGLKTCNFNPNLAYRTLDWSCILSIEFIEVYECCCLSTAFVLQEIVKEINIIEKEIEGCRDRSRQLLEDARQFLNDARLAYSQVEEELSRLDSAIKQIEPFVENLESENIRLRPLVENATEHAKKLRQQADLLDRFWIVTFIGSLVCTRCRYDLKRYYIYNPGNQVNFAITNIYLQINKKAAQEQFRQRFVNINCLISTENLWSVYSQRHETGQWSLYVYMMALMSTV